MTCEEQELGLIFKFYFSTIEDRRSFWTGRKTDFLVKLEQIFVSELSSTSRAVFRLERRQAFEAGLMATRNYSGSKAFDLIILLEANFAGVVVILKL
jgi:hypothetical protein